MAQPENDEFVLLVDPEWQNPEWQDPEAGGAPPFAAVVGMWPRLPDGTTGEFRPNPEYVPSFETSPTDPVDAALRLLLSGDVEPEILREVLLGSRVEVAMNGDGRPMVARSDDGVLCATIATSAVHRRRLFSPEWRQVSTAELLEVLAEGTDVLANPGSPAHVRLAYDFLLSATGTTATGTTAAAGAATTGETSTPVANDEAQS